MRLGRIDLDLYATTGATVQLGNHRITPPDFGDNIITISLAKVLAPRLMLWLCRRSSAK